MLHAHIGVICVQVRDDEQTERFVVFSSALPLADSRRRLSSMPNDVTCTGLIDEAGVRRELSGGGITAEDLNARINRARGFKTTATSRALLENWVTAVKRALPGRP